METELKPKQHYEDESKNVDEPKESNHDQFWSENPNMLLHKDHILEFFPTEDMSFNQKLNSVTRIVLLMTLITFAYTRGGHILLVGAVSMFFIYMLHKYRSEGFALSPNVSELVDITQSTPDSVFQKPSPSNPMGNVLVTDYIYNPKRKPAPPAYNESVSANIVTQAKEMVKNSNPNNPDIADKLFKDLGDEYMFEQSLQPFYSTASTTIPNDQQSFTEFCYGSMISCKEGNAFACAKNNSIKYNLH